MRRRNSANSLTLSSLTRRTENLRQPAVAIGRDQIVEPADVMTVDENLRHGAALRARDHLVALGRIGVDADFGVVQPFLLQKVLRRHAVGAVHAAVDFDVVRHKNPRCRGCQHGAQPAELKFNE